jgi:hypothetical protein
MDESLFFALFIIPIIMFMACFYILVDTLKVIIKKQDAIMAKLIEIKFR